MNFNIGKIILGLINPELFLRKPQNPLQNNTENFAQQINPEVINQKPQPQVQNRPEIINTPIQSETSNTKPRPNNAAQNIENSIKMTENYKMNGLTQTDRSVYIKNLLGLPQTLGEILQNAQNLNKPLIGGTLGMANMNQALLQTQGALSEVFEEMNPVIQNTQDIVNILNTQVQQAAVTRQDAVALMFSGMISMPEISKLILQNSKQAVAALIISMASASKNGLDPKQLQDTLSVINSCISMAESDNPAQNLKSLMMLYLPWLPLNEGIGFDLEITQPDGENESNDSKLTVLIQTKNYGNLKGVFTLTTSNSVDVYIICSDKFPKAELLKNLKSEGSSHAMNTNIDIEDVKPVNEDLNETRETKVNLSATNEMNPYLLLMAHSFIRNTILIDNAGLAVNVKN